MICPAANRMRGRMCERGAPMDETAVIRHITETFDGIDLLQASGDSYFYYDPNRDVPHDRRFPFATLVTGDRYDQASDLGRPGVYRLNIGLTRDTYRTLFGPPPRYPVTGDVIETGQDFAALDQVMPHPVYSPMFWVCVLNPSDATFCVQVQPLLAEAYALDVTKYANRAARSDG